MDSVHLFFVIVHSLGAVAILVGAIGTWSNGGRGFLYTLLWSARLQVLTGLVLAVLAFANDDALVLKLAVKLLVALVIAGLAEMSARRERRSYLMAAITALTIANIAIAVAWH